MHAEMGGMWAWMRCGRHGWDVDRASERGQGLDGRIAHMHMVSQPKQQCDVSRLAMRSFQCRSDLMDCTG